MKLMRKRFNVVSPDGKSYSGKLREIWEKTKVVPFHNVRDRLYSGWTLERALFVPLMPLTARVRPCPQCGHGLYSNSHYCPKCDFVTEAGKRADERLDKRWSLKNDDQKRAG